MDKKKVIDLMNRALELEYQAFMQYFYQGLLLKGFSTMAMAQMLKTEADVELGHAKMLAAKIVTLGGMPGTSMGNIEISGTPNDMIKANIKREKLAIGVYRELLPLVEEDEGLYVMFEQIISDELSDLADFESMLES